MILEKTPITLIEVKEYVKRAEENKELSAYLKKFVLLTKEKAEKLKEDIRGLNNQKIKEENISKIVDFLPKTKEEVNKILTGAMLSEDEANAITAITKEY